MDSNSIETLLLRHYGNAASVPAGLEEKLRASVHYQAEESRKAQLAAARLQHKRVSRRQAIRLVARGASKTGLDLLSTGLEGLQVLEATLIGQDTTQPVLP
jgi:hypothetical protein